MMLAAVCVAVAGALVAWRWWLAERRFEVTHRAQVRDEALATFEPRIRAIEEAMKSAEWSKVARR